MIKNRATVTSREGLYDFSARKMQDNFTFGDQGQFGNSANKFFCKEQTKQKLENSKQFERRL